MKTSTKKALLIALILCLAGIIVGIIGFGLMDSSFTDFEAEPLTESNFTFTEEINLFGITTDTANVEIVLYDGDEIKVVCRESEKEKHKVYVNNDTLYIEVIEQRKWYDYIEVYGIFGSDDTKIAVYLPKNEYASMEIETDTGDITIPVGLTLESLVVKSDTGDIDIRTSVEDVIWISTDTGNVWAENVSATTMKITTDTGFINLVNAEVSGTIILEADSGDVQLQNVRAVAVNTETDTGDVVLDNTIIAGAIKIETNTGDVKFLNSIGGVLDITTDTGDVTFSSSDATTITVVTDTGDVEGTLLTGKNFLVESGTGDISIPKSTNRGKCEITTDTGDIRIAVGR